MAANTVLGVYNRERLPDALATLHRNGYGPNVRVLDAARGPLAGQLQRAGVAEPPVLTDAVQLLVMVFAPARVGQVIDLLQGTGSQNIHLVERPHRQEPAAMLRGLVQTPARAPRRSASTSGTARSTDTRPAPDVADPPAPAD